MTIRKHPGGRPTEYDPSYCDLVVKVMTQGFSVTGFAGKVGVSRQTVTNWQRQYPDFAEAVRIGLTARTMSYERKAWDVAMGNGGPGSASMIQFALRNMAPEDYAEVKHLRHGGHDGGPIKTVDLTNLSDDQLNALEAVFGPLAAAGDDGGRDSGGEGEESGGG